MRDRVGAASDQMIGASGSHCVDRDLRYEPTPKWIDIGKPEGVEGRSRKLGRIERGALRQADK